MGNLFLSRGPPMLPRSCCTRPRQNQVIPGEGPVACAGPSALGTLNQVGLQQLGRAQAGQGTAVRVRGRAGALGRALGVGPGGGPGPPLLCPLPPECLSLLDAWRTPHSGSPAQTGRHRREDGFPLLVPKTMSEMSCSHPSGGERRGRGPRCGRDGWTLTSLGWTYPCSW